MDAPDEMVEAVAEALRVERRIQDERDDPYAFYDYWPDMARAALAVPALAEVIARDAQVREIVARQDGLVLDQAIGFIQIRSLHHAGDGWGVWAEDDIPATMLRDGEG